jgi:TP901 family phage tail tape measure protein
MIDFATLVLGADTRGLDRGVTSLEHVVRAGGRAEKATGSAEKSFGRASAGMGALAAAAVAAAGGMATLNAAMQQARQFGAAVAEVTTLMGSSASEVALLEKNARALGVAYGSGATPQVQAFYQAISAGAGDVAAATVLLDQANKLAIGGVTNVTTAVDILTTATNVYRDSGLTAAEASDALFVAMRAGKTTITELSASLGKVLPLANNLGVSFDEVAAATAALTLGGISTAESVTGLRAAMTSILGPSKQASDLAKQLGIEFSASGLEAQGFAGFMADVVAKTGGSSTAMQTLFGSVEATTVALALAGSAGDSLGTILEQMGIKAGATDEAFQKMAASFDQRLNRAMAALGDIALTVGNALLTVIVPALEAAAVAATFVSQNAGIMAVALAGLAATQLPGMAVATAAAVRQMIALEFALGATTVRAAAASIAIKAYQAVAITATGATRGLGVAMSFLGGPLGLVAGLLGAGAAAAVIFGRDTKATESTSYDAAAAAAQLGGELTALAEKDLPDATAKTVDLANANVALAKTAYEAARAQNELAIAALAAADDQLGNEGMSGIESDLLPGQAARTASIEKLRKAQAELAKAEAELNARIFEGNQVKLDATEVVRKLEVNVGGLDDASLGAGRAMQKAADDALALSQQFDGPLSGAIDGVAGAFGDFIARGFRDFKGFTQSIVGAFSRMLSQMVADAAKTQIFKALGLGGGGAVATAGAAAAGTGAAAAGTAAAGAGIIGTLSTFGGGISAGLSGVLGGGGIGAGISGGLAAGGAAGFGTALGAAIPILAPLAIGAALLGRRRKRRQRRAAAAQAAEQARLQAEQAAEQARLAEEQRQAAIREEAFDIENRLLTLQGRSAEVLARERQKRLDAADASNRAALQQVFALEDQQKAVEEASARLEAAQARVLDLFRNPLSLDSERFDNRFTATMQAAEDRRFEVQKAAEDAQLTELKLMRLALEELRREQRDIRLYGSPV